MKAPAAQDGFARTVRDPITSAEWQEAIDGAAGLRAIADCKMYGLIEGGPEIDVARCDEILKRARQRGFRPSRPTVQLALGMLRAINQEAEERVRNENTDDFERVAARSGAPGQTLRSGDDQAED